MATHFPEEALNFLFALEKPDVLSAECQVLQTRSLPAEYLEGFFFPSEPLCDNTRTHPPEPRRGNARLRGTLISRRIITIVRIQKKNCRPRKSTLTFPSTA